MSEKNKVSNTRSSYTKEKKKYLVWEKRNTKTEGERPPTQIKIAGTLATENLDEQLIEEVAKQVGEVWGFYLTDKATAAMEGIVKTPFATWIKKEERPKDFNSPALEKFEGNGDPMAHLLHFK